jgi:thiamine-phosphate diphosphorylase
VGPGERHQCGTAAAMRPLPRLHAFTDAAVLGAADFGVRAAAIAAAGPVVALHARDRGGSVGRLAAAAARLGALARPPEAAVFVNGRPDVAAAVNAQGVQLGAGDLAPDDARKVLRHGWIGRSVHTVEEAQRAIEEGADFLVVGNIYETSTHPGRPARGLRLVSELARLGRPVIAIGGVTPARAPEVKAAGAYGVAAIRALWLADDPAAATLLLLAPWLETT